MSFNVRLARTPCIPTRVRGVLFSSSHPLQKTALRGEASTVADTTNPLSSTESVEGNGKGGQGARKPSLAERVLLDRKVPSISHIMHTPQERISTQISTRTAHRILPLSPRDDAGRAVRLLARSILLKQRERAATPLSGKIGIPPLTPVNGVGRFVLPLQRVVFTYCSHARDSDGVKEYLKANLKALAESNPSVEFVVEPRWGHFPLIRGFFLHGREKVICVKNYTLHQVHEAFMMLRNSSGTPLKKFRQAVKSTAPAVRPLWSPFHSLSSYKNNYLLPFTNAKGRKATQVTR